MKKSRLRKSKKQLSKKIGMAPGSLVYIGSVDANAAQTLQPVVSVMIYDAAELTEQTLSAEALANFKLTDYSKAGKKVWLNVHGVHDADLIKKIGDLFHLHPLVQEDILNTEQRPKIDEFDDYVFLETRCFRYDQSTMGIDSEQVSFVLGRDYLLTFQERATGNFEPVRTRMRASRAHIRELGVDYLAYALLDSVVDKYFSVLESVGDASEALEEVLLHKPTNTELHAIHQLKHVSIELRRAVWPLREVINTLSRNENDFFKPTTMPYLRDVYDHTVSFIESLESIRDALSGMMDIYMASVSQRVNLEVRALTVVAMLFMPATLIAGIFGMNFHEMPWLADKDGFWWAMGLMLGIALVMLTIFWRRQWLTSQT
ncbi:MAG: magnesium and cobalt transport protein CorA [Methylotenera sp.]|uniref:magnesium/cobalt transporter CorA n=1 Tax=Methylotenera sp. TaxID=2051956 RepID=UPI000D48941E|nr:magnesium/cobalt transporter CorA [Methylotenera sp.]PPC83582.1 MAG: magnesium and cobalt transport protein CorA [Methylotenera sp.]